MTILALATLIPTVLAGFYLIPLSTLVWVLWGCHVALPAGMLTLLCLMVVVLSQ